MAISNVYYISMRTTPTENLLQELERLVREAGMMNTDFNNKYTTIEVHFDRSGNLTYLRANYSKVLVNLIRSQGGKVFLTSCNTLYVGWRRNALDHLGAAYGNGCNSFTTGCHIMVAGGLKGTDEALVPIDGEYVKEAEIGRAVMDADIVIPPTCFKRHGATGFGDTLENLDMGSGSRAGKMEMHNAGRPFVHTDKCVGYGACQKNYTHGAIMVFEWETSADTNKHAGCGRCIDACPADVVNSMYDEASDIPNREIVEYTLAVLRDRPNSHVSLVADISPNCSCHLENDAPIVPNVGIFASFNPIAPDMACVDAVNRRPVLTGGFLSEQEHRDYNHLINTYPNINWETCIDHAVKLGLGNGEYNLITTQNLTIRRTREA